MSDLDIIIFAIAGVVIILISLYVVISMTQDINETICKCNEIGAWAKKNWKGEPMDRDEFMELVYETFADEPDNVLANGIIEAADAYVEYEKAQLFHDGTTSDLISRQQTLNALMDAVKSVGILDADDIKTVFDALPSVQHEKAQLPQQGTTSDLISKTETVEHLRRVLEATVPNTDYDEGFIDGVEFGVSTVSTMSPAQPEPKEGHWIEGKIYRDVIECNCSECGQLMTTAATVRMNYCPNCGADMRGEKDG